MNIIGFVPARGGSVGIKNKNLVMLNGQPLIKYTLDILKELNNIAQPFISTDSIKIKRYCERNGFKNNYLRPKKLGTSSSNVVDAVLHGVNWILKNKKVKVDTILLLQPTSPLRYLGEIKKAIKIFKEKKLNSLASVSPLKEHPFETVEIKKNKWKFLRESKKKVFRRQQFNNNFFFIDGNFYLVKLNFLKKNKCFIKKNITTFFKLKRYWPIDIDNNEDLIVASSLIKQK